MGCLCQEVAGPDVKLSPICLEHLWILDNLPSSEVSELVHKAERKKLMKGVTLLMQSDPAD